MTDAKAILDFAKERCEPKILLIRHGDEEEVAPVPLFVDGRGGASSVRKLVDEWRLRPARRSGRISTTTIESFIALVNRDADPKRSVIFADNGDKPKLVAVLNFHDESPQFCDDRIEYAFPLSEEWQTDILVNGKPITKAAQIDKAGNAVPRQLAHAIVAANTRPVKVGRLEEACA